MRLKIFLLLGMFSCACALHATTAAKGVFSVAAGKTVQFANAPETGLVKWKTALTMQDENWKLLTGAEWSYLLADGRTDANILNSLGTINGEKVLIILPDGWVKPDGVPEFSTTYMSDGYGTNTYTTETWALMAESGAIYLPCGGYSENGKDVINPTDHGAYWAADIYPANNAQAYSIHFNDGEIHDQNTFADTTRYYSVILVRDVTNTVLDEEDDATEYSSKWTAAKTKDFAYVNRTLVKDGTYYTLCLPFDVPDIDDSPLEGAEVFEFAGGAVSGATGAEQLYLNLKRLSGKRLTHGVPYLLRWSNTGDTLPKPLYFANVENWDDNTTADSVGNATVKLCGLYPKTHIQDYTAGVAHYHFFMGANNTLYWPDAAYTHAAGHDMKGFRAYFYITPGGYPSSAPLRTMPVVWNISGGFGSATGTEAVTGCGLQVTGTKLFRNGQIVLVIDGKMYDLQGKKIKD